MVQIDQQQTTELMLLPIGQHRAGRRSLKAHHHDRADLLIERHATRSQLIGWRRDRG